MSSSWAKWLGQSIEGLEALSLGGFRVDARLKEQVVGTGVSGLWVE